jgi:DNA-binding beta-propeller fold protein YncE
VFSPTGDFLREFGESGSGQGQLKRPTGLSVDAGGNVAVADQDNDRVQIFDPNGNVSLAVGQPGAAVGQLAQPGGVVFGSNGRLTVTDTVNDRIQQFTLRRSRRS